MFDILNSNRINKCPKCKVDATIFVDQGVRELIVYNKCGKKEEVLNEWEEYQIICPECHLAQINSDILIPQ